MSTTTTLHAICTLEYTLCAKPAGTYSLVAVPVLQGPIMSVPNALLPIEERDVESLMLDRLVLPVKTVAPMETTLVGMSTLCRLML